MTALNSSVQSDFPTRPLPCTYLPAGDGDGDGGQWRNARPGKSQLRSERAVRGFRPCAGTHYARFGSPQHQTMPSGCHQRRRWRIN